MVKMKEEKIELLRLKGEILENSIENLKEKLDGKNQKIEKLQRKIIQILELLKSTNGSIYDNINMSQSTVLSKPQSYLKPHYRKKSKTSVQNSQNADSHKNLRYSTGMRSTRLSNHYRWNKQGLLEKRDDSQVSRTEFRDSERPQENFPELTNVLQKVIQSRIALKQAKEEERSFSTIYDQDRIEGAEDRDAGMRFERSYRDLLRNYDKYSLIKIIEKFKGVHEFGVRR